MQASEQASKQASKHASEQASQQASQTGKQADKEASQPASKDNVSVYRSSFPSLDKAFWVLGGCPIRPRGALGPGVPQRPTINRLISRPQKAQNHYKEILKSFSMRVKVVYKNVLGLWLDSKRPFKSFQRSFKRCFCKWPSEAF